MQLIGDVQRIVKEKFDVVLEPEVKRVGPVLKEENYEICNRYGHVRSRKKQVLSKCWKI